MMSTITGYGTRIWHHSIDKWFCRYEQPSSVGNVVQGSVKMTTGVPLGLAQFGIVKFTEEYIGKENYLHIAHQNSVIYHHLNPESQPSVSQKFKNAPPMSSTLLLASIMASTLQFPWFFRLPFSAGLPPSLLKSNNYWVVRKKNARIKPFIAICIPIFDFNNNHKIKLGVALSRPTQMYFEIS